MHPLKHLSWGFFGLLALVGPSLQQNPNQCDHHIIVHGNQTDIIKSCIHAVDCVLQITADFSFDYDIKYLPSSNTNITNTFNRASHYIRATGPLKGNGQTIYDKYFKSSIESLNRECSYWREGIEDAARYNIGPAGLNCSEIAAVPPQLNAVNTLMNGFGYVFNSTMSNKMSEKLKPCWNEFDQLAIFVNTVMRPLSKCH